MNKKRKRNAKKMIRQNLLLYLILFGLGYAVLGNTLYYDENYNEYEAENADWQEDAVTAEHTVYDVVTEERSETDAPTSARASLEYGFDYDTMTAAMYSGDPYSVLNDNKPYFTEDELTTTSFEQYSDLDDLGRCGVAVACVGQDIMPTEDRGQIGQVKPTGWHTVKYNDLIDGNYLYNRCHLIAFCLTGENANEKNLITGTRYLNVDGMLPFELQVARYVESTGNHVMYRVTPIFKGTNLVCEGVLMEAQSVEDDEISFCVFCYNVQPGIVIDYVTGKSQEE